MKKYVSLVLLLALCCAIPAFAARGVIAEDSADNYTAATFVNGANLGTGFQPWEFWCTPPTLADCTAGSCIGNINSANGVAFRFARDEVDGEDHWGYSNGYRGFDALNTGDVLTFKFACAYCNGNRGLDLFGNGGHADSDKIANVINLSGNNIYSVNGVTVSEDWAPNAVSEVTVEQLDDGIKLSVKRTKSDGNVDVDYTTTVTTATKLTGIGLYAGGWDWNNGADVENYAFYVNDLKIEGEVPDGGALTLVEDTGDWLVNTPDPTTFNYTVSIPAAVADDVQVQLGIAGSFGELSARSVTIPAGETSADFTVTAQVNRAGNYARVTVSADNYSSDYEQIYGPGVGWSMQVTHTGTQTEDYFLDGGDTVQFWINNTSDTGTPANAYITASTTDGEVLACSDLAEWADADPDPGTYTSGLLTASEPAADTQVTFQIKFGDVVFHEYTFTVFPAPAPLSVEWPASLTVGDTATVTVTANGLDGHTLLVSADDGGTYATLGGDIDAEGYLYPEGDSWTGSFTIEATAPSGEAILFKVEDVDNEEIVSSVELAINAFVPTLSLEPVGGWAVTDPDTTVTFTVKCDPAPESALTLDVSAATPDWGTAYDYTLPEAGSVVIAAGETSTTFEVGLKATGANNAIDVTVSDPLDGGYQASTYGVHGPSFGEGGTTYRMTGIDNWVFTRVGDKTDPWDFAAGDTLKFWIDNDDAANYGACDAFITITTTDGAALACEATPWADNGNGGTFTEILLTANDTGEYKDSTFQVKFGDAILYQYGFHVYGTAGGETVEIPLDSLAFAEGVFSFAVPEGYVVSKVEYATEIVDGNWNFANETTFQVNIGIATVDLPAEDNAIFRVTFEK